MIYKKRKEAIERNQRAFLGEKEDAVAVAVSNPLEKYLLLSSLRHPLFHSSNQSQKIYQPRFISIQ